MQFKYCDYLNVCYLEHKKAHGRRNENNVHDKQVVSLSNKMEILEEYVLPSPSNYLTLLEEDIKESIYDQIPYNYTVSNPINQHLFQYKIVLIKHMSFSDICKIFCSFIFESFITPKYSYESLNAINFPGH